MTDRDPINFAGRQIRSARFTNQISISLAGIRKGSRPKVIQCYRKSPTLEESMSRSYNWEIQDVKECL